VLPTDSIGVRDQRDSGCLMAVACITLNSPRDTLRRIGRRVRWATSLYSGEKWGLPSNSVGFSLKSIGCISGVLRMYL
jgi:hypothetical protein